MPELPEVETTKRGVEPWLLGQTIIEVVVRQPQLRWLIPAEVQLLCGTKVESLSRRAKYLLVHTAMGTAIWHLGMSGSLRIVEAGTEPGKHDHVDWVLSNGKVLRYHDPRRFGALLFVSPGESSSLLAKLGPEPLTAEFTGEYLWQQSRNRTKAVKTFIMDNAVVVGVGNIYANESLFMAGIRPQTPAGKISQARYDLLVTHIKSILQQAIKQGGTTLKDFVGGDGKPGYFAQELLVYGRGGQECVNCHSLLKELRIGQRNSVYCPKCQH